MRSAALVKGDLYIYIQESVMARRTGVPTMVSVAKRLCDLINRYGFIITGLYPTNTALAAALAAANAACANLHAELEAVREIGD